ncbi:putative uncharacterized protein DDB_G0286901 [Leptidea sinapis]|uniref:putative uncharacterized protein DDB_G0286901 n=1 Tax=Leptidea sinapis TaxID=189913 RepID=UPI0021C48080|nr:putative uncharacterized protein DDB_G0286901 [Leptidea sinapis]
MSLLEDVFLQDEANEANELERIIEGGDHEERYSDDNSEKEGEAEEDKRRVDPSSTKSKRVIKNPRFVLNPARLTGPRGIHVIPEHFQDFKFKGKGHEKEDLDVVLKKLEHWAYRLYPKFQFEDCLKKIEALGKKRAVMVNLHKIRSDQFTSEERVVQQDLSDEDVPQEDEFDKLLQQQIELARSTPAKAAENIESSQAANRTLIMPKPTSSPSISEEQKERMIRNRKLAEERRLAKLKNLENNMSHPESDINMNASEILTDKHNINETVIEVQIETHRTSIDTQERIATDIQEGHKDSNKLTGSKIGEVENKNNIGDKSETDLLKNLGTDNIANDSDVSETVTEENLQANTQDGNEITESTPEVNVDNVTRGPGYESQKNITDGTNSYQKSGNSSGQNIDTNDLPSNDLAVDDKTISDPNNLNLNRISPIERVIENNIIQSTIQGLVENDNNLNHERDLINQDLVQEAAGSRDMLNNDIMDVDFSEEF